NKTAQGRQERRTRFYFGLTVIHPLWKGWRASALRPSRPSSPKLERFRFPVNGDERPLYIHLKHTGNVAGETHRTTEATPQGGLASSRSIPLTLSDFCSRGSNYVWIWRLYYRAR